MLILWISKFTSFVQIWFILLVSRNCNFITVCWSKDRFLEIIKLNWKYCSPHFWHGYMADIKIKRFWFSNVITFAQIYFKSTFSRIPILETCISLKVCFRKYQTGNSSVQIFEVVTKSKCYYFELVNSYILSKFYLNHRFEGD